ncbi:S-layer homology domain-containing protein [Bacillus horti]|uniref:SLH domain-containing protein n=1 Tax=Caldalkalibacillus horti TaxID=77523 RepID=A0ABT9W0H3_9BACI|nr:S-layer homology domain-containing protein [Bacillus horti]MDQ0166365.1 hypothetical protein [Bacillus horti]
MKKSLVSLLIFALVFTMVAPAFAAVNDIENSHAKEEIEALIEAGIINGYTDGTFKPRNEITRAEVAKILALVLELEEDAEAASVFTDVPAWAAPYVGALVNAEITQGQSETRFGSNVNVSRQELAVFFARAMELYEEAQESDLEVSFSDASSVAAWARGAVALAAEIELVNGFPNGTFGPTQGALRQDVAALSHRFWVGSEEYIERAREVLQAAQPTLEVTGVTATNLKEAVVTFNQDLHEGSIADANFTVKNEAGETTETTATLSEEGNVVVLTVKEQDGHFDNQETYTLTVERVQSASNVAIETTEVEFTAFDRELPEVEEVVVTGPRSFDIIFSEPIKGNEEAQNSAVEVRSENSTIGASQGFEGFGTRTISVELFSDMVDGRTYDVTIRNFVDYADYRNVVTTYELLYEKDETAPVATVTKAEQEYVIVKFNKPVSGLTANHFYHSFSTWRAVGIYKDAKFEQAILPTDKVSTVYVTFYESDEDGEEVAGSRPLPEGNVTFVAAAKHDSNEVKDNWGNNFEETVFELTIAADRVTPEVTDITVRSERVLRVAFNKPVHFNASNIEVLNTDGSRISGVNEVVTAVSNTNSFDVNLGTDLPGRTVLVRITDVEDRTLAGNKLATYTETLTIGDKQAPEVVDVLWETTTDSSGTPIVNETARTIFVVYNESVNSTATARANYKLVDGNNLVTFNGTASFYNDNRIVRLVFTESQWNDLRGTRFSGLQVTNVEDTAGNNLVGQTYSKSRFILKNQYVPAVDSVEAIATDKLQVTFEQFLPVVERGAFTINGQPAAALTLSTNSDGQTVATLTTASNARFEADITGANYTIASGGNGSRVQNIFNVALPTTNEGNEPVVDKIAPTVVDRQVYVDASAGIIEIQFTEALESETFADSGRNGFSVSGGSLTSASLKDGDNSVVVLRGSNFTTNTRISYNGTNITDTANPGNRLASFNYTRALVADDLGAPAPGPTPEEEAREALEDLIADNSTLKASAELLLPADENDYVAEHTALVSAIEAYDTALAAAEDTLDIAEATEGQLETAANNLQSAINALEAAITAVEGLE